MAKDTAPPSIQEFLQRHAPFQQMEAVHLDYLLGHLEAGFYHKEELILSAVRPPSDTFYIVKQGVVRGLDDQGDGEPRRVVWELTAGECFPIGALLDRRRVAVDYVVAEDTFCLELPREHFDHLLQTSPVFLDFCLRRLSTLLRLSLQEAQSDTINRIADEMPLHSSLASFVRREPVICLEQTPVEEVFRKMSEERVGSVIVVKGKRTPVGILTLRDVLPRVVLPGISLETPVSELMTPDPHGLPMEASAFEAAMVMAERGIAHLCVMGPDGLTGVVSERDIFSLQRIGLVNLTRAILGAENVPELAQAAAQVPPLIDQMLAHGLGVAQLIHIITSLNDHIARQAISLVCAKSGDNLPEFTWLTFGSEGRREQTLRTDQDNGILFVPPAGVDAESIRARLLPVAEKINQALAECGFPLCLGNIMAQNPACCLSLEEWQGQFSAWIDQGAPEHLLNASIFFDLRSISGDPAPAAALWRWVVEHIPRNPRFLRQMAENALRNAPPLGLFRDFQVSRGGEHPHTLNLKVQGLTPFVDSARLLALANGIIETNTMRRLQLLAEAGVIKTGDADAWTEAIVFLQVIRMRLHHDQSGLGLALENHINPDTLNELDRRLLKEVFRQARKIQARLAVDYQL